MGVSNFARSNASKVFAVLMDTEEKYSKCSECDNQQWEWEEGYIEEENQNCPNCDCKGCIRHDTEYRNCEDFEVNDLKSYISELAQEKKGNFKYQKESGSDNDRNYCASYLFSLNAFKSFGDIEVECKITAKLVGAYYEGASLDWDFEIYNGGEWSAVENGYYTVTEKNIVEDLFDVGYNQHSYSNMSSGLRTIHAKTATKWAEKTKTEMVDLIESIFEQVSNPLQVVATFSNGETIYESVK